MQGVLDWGITVVLWLQRFSPALDLPFRAFTFLGEEDFLILFLPFVFWSLDRRTGAGLAFLFLVSTFTNAVVKVMGGQPRPYEYDKTVQKLFEVSGPGFPSNHTQSTVVVWGYLASQVQRKWGWVLAGILMVSVPLSRMYLGLHFPTDLLGGYVIGVAFLALYLWLEPGVEAWLSGRHLALQLGLAVAAPLVLFALYPTADEQALTSLAVMAGMGVGLVFERRWVSFETAGSWLQRALRFLLGLVVLMVLRFGLKAALEGLEPEPLFHFARYAVIGLAVGWPMPWVFVQLRLAGRKAPAASRA